MSKSFRNTIATIAALEGFTNMLFDLTITHQVEAEKPVLDSLLETIRKVKQQSRIAQSHCHGTLTQNEYHQIEKAIKDNAALFTVGGDKLMDIVAYISFSLIGMDNVINDLKVVKSKNRKPLKIKAFETLATEGFKMLQFFDPKMESIDKYEHADYARKKWEIIFDI